MGASIYIFLLYLTLALQNLKKGCWRECDGEGPCSWCGLEGMCCRQGWATNGCDGHVGGFWRHECTKAPKAPDG